MTLAQLRHAYEEAVRRLQLAESYAAPVPTSGMVLAELRARRLDASTADIKQACALTNPPLADL